MTRIEDLTQNDITETLPSSTYSVDFSKFIPPSDGSPVNIKTVATAGIQYPKIADFNRCLTGDGRLVPGIATPKQKDL